MALQNPYYFPQYPQAYPQGYQFNTQQTQAQAQPQQIQQIQNGGFVSIRGEQEARSYPVAVGMSVTFKDETAPYIYTKTMGFSQLDTPRFEKFKLVKEDDTPISNVGGPNSHEKEKDIDLSMYVLKSDFDAFKDVVDDMAADLEKLKGKKVKKEAADND